MLTYKDILTAFTKKIRKEFMIDVFTTQTNQGFENQCFYVSVIPSKTLRVSQRMHQKNLTISIKYFSDGDKMKLYEIANSLEALFSKKINVKEREIIISSSEPNFLNDEVGDFLDFLISISFFDNDVKTREEIEEIEALEPMGEININERVIE